MANYKRVVLTEKENNNVSNGVTAVDKQLSKFDTSYTSKKLNDLYSEFDSITFEESNSTIVKNNAVDVKASASFKTKVFLTTAVIITMLLAFLAIYNIFVINGLNAGIKMLQEEVVITGSDLEQLQNSIAGLTEEEIKKLIEETFGGEFGSITDNGVVIIEDIPTSKINGNYESTNWFDELCSFFCNLFGG